MVSGAVRQNLKFYMIVIADLKNCGVNNILITIVDELKGFEEAIQISFAKTQIQKCVVQQV